MLVLAKVSVDTILTLLHHRSEGACRNSESMFQLYFFQRIDDGWDPNQR